MQKNRICYLDVLRVIACVCVITIHSSSVYVQEKTGSLNFWVGNIFDAVAIMAVPIFVMISGALMLDQNYDFNKDKLIKHIKKMLVFFAFWSFFYCIISKALIPVLNNESLNLKSIIERFIMGHYHLWFIYMIIGLYLITPLLRLWVKDSNREYVKYFMILAFVFSFLLPQIFNIGSNYSNWFIIFNNVLNNYLQLKYVGGFITYFILGWYINNYDFKSKKTIYILGILGGLISIIGTYILSITTGMSIQMYDCFSINTLFQTIALFVLIKNIYYNKKSNKMINLISKYSLGIYAMHPLFIELVSKGLNKININYILINLPVTIVLTFVLSFLFSYIISKIPFIKKVV